MKNLIVINGSKMPFSALQKALQAHQKRCQIGKTKASSFDANALIALIYPKSPISGQLALLKKIKSKWPNLKVVFAGLEPNAGDVIQLFREGLADYLVNTIDIRDINLAVQRLECKQVNLQFNPLDFNLTQREFEVCKLLVRGHKSKDVADHLQITPATIKVHKARIMRKLQVSNLPDLVRAVAI